MTHPAPPAATLAAKWQGRAQRLRVPLGFVTATLFLVLARPTPLGLTVGAGISLLGLGWRAWAAGHIRKDEVLTVLGPYRLTRNPLYLGSALMMLGCLVAGAPWPAALALATLFVGIYWPVMQAEAKHLAKLFPDDYPAYAAQTPLFVPDLRRFGAAWRDGFDWTRYRHHREYQAALGLLMVFVLLAVKLWRQG
ncbi:MAG: methyltransferase [Chloracidobacterium sp.]|uniref:Isoprenylcysteine carboxylmethyltransferase family protein n=1 Tax=Chloracidobacterium validum TaxID=2821543 RepID=A0ABX8BBH0_9BACT|nr:methyltransferase [Chloracidobacterium validum]QUW02998.1 isoprenylcysteine carboxylmethyltransferase family protein [Chloracidobacterium validum]